MNSKIFCIPLLFLQLISLAQQSERCASQIKMDEYVGLHPEAQQKIQQQQEEVSNFISNNFNRENQNQIIRIPVVFHVIHSGEPVDSGYNISVGQIQSQLDILNQCFRLRNADTVLIPSWFRNKKADVEVEFCLAAFDTSGAPTTGITRHNFPNTSNFDFNIKPITHWDHTHYLNIWTTDLGNTVLGYATAPNLFPGEQDGVVIDYRRVGKASSNPFATTHDSGRTAVHEVGHWLGLYHTFKDSCAGMTPQTCATEGDFICDTPPTAEATYGQPNLVQNSCHETPVDEYDMWMNYMDYADDDQMHLFTHDQSDVMRATLNTSRLSIQSSAACAPLGAAQNENTIQHFSVYPNPSNGNFVVNYLVEGEQKILLSATNVLGEEIFSREINQASSKTLLLDFSAQLNGIYFLCLQTKHSKKTLKISLLN